VPASGEPAVGRSPSCASRPKAENSSSRRAASGRRPSRTASTTRFQHRGVRADLDQGIEALRVAVRLRPADHPRGLALARANLANALRLSFDRGGPLSDIEEAVDALRGKLPFDSEELNRAATLCALGEALASRYRRTLEDMLAWLWDAVAGPVLDALGHRPVPSGGTPPRLWWVPTGLLTLLPLHAAGRAGDGVLDRVMSSYAPTVGTLAHARNAASATGPAQVTVVALPGDDLPNAQRESRDIGILFPGARQLVDDRATRANVLDVLPKSHVVHFACHASQDLVNPAHGHLRLYDGALDVLELARLRLGTAELASLSACQTATGGITLADEAVHLASAFQLAGYRQVIGTLWPIQDAVAADIATDVYTQLRRDGGGVATGHAAAALHGAIRRARAAHPREPHLWASHIHLGP
jgi:hypothetical protein